MKKWFRWWGIGVFAALVIVLAAGWLLLADWIVKNALETAGTRAVGARVDIADADLSLFPAGLALTGLQVTNPQQPMRNAVEAKRVALTLDAAGLLRRKILIEEMTVDGVRLNTPRKKSGAVKSAASRKGDTAGDSSPAGEPLERLEQMLSSGLAIPDVKEILKKEKLQTLALAESLQSDIETEKGRWELRLKQLPDKQTLESYRDRIDDLKSAGKGGLGALLGAATEVVALQKEIEADIDRIETAAGVFERQSKRFEQQMKQLSRAPAADLQRLKSKYSLSAKGLSNISALFLQQRLQVWLERAVGWYERLQPLLSRPSAASEEPQQTVALRGKGVNVRFAETNPQPDFLIRRATVGMEVARIQLSGVIETITSDPQLVGRPLRFDFSGKDAAAAGTIRLNGLFDATAPPKTRAKADLKLQNVAVAPRDLVNKPGLTARLQSARVDLDIRSALDDERIGATLDAGLDPIRITAESGKGADAFASALTAALTGVRRMKATAAVKGTLTQPKIRLTTDLDRVLKDAVAGLAVREARKLEKALQKEIYAQTNTPLKQTGLELDQFGLIGEELAKRLNLGDNLLNGLL